MSAEPAGPEAAALTGLQDRRRRVQRDPQRAGRYRSLTHAYAQLRKLQRLSGIGFGVLMLGLCVWALRATARERAAESLRLQERGDLLQLRRELDAVRAEIGVLVAGRIPGLHELSF